MLPMTVEVLNIEALTYLEASIVREATSTRIRFGEIQQRIDKLDLAIDALRVLLARQDRLLETVGNLSEQVERLAGKVHGGG